MKDTENKNKIYDRLVSLKPKRLLELGPCYGEDTAVMSGLCEDLVTVDGKSANVQKVRALGLPNVTVIEENLEVFDLTGLGKFDLVVAIGILYHLPKPWELIAAIQKVAPICLGWTHLTPIATADVDGHQVWPWPEVIGHDFAGLSPVSNWLTPDGFAACWQGWTFNWLNAIKPHINGGVAAQFEAHQ